MITETFQFGHIDVILSVARGGMAFESRRFGESAKLFDLLHGRLDISFWAENIHP